MCQAPIEYECTDDHCGNEWTAPPDGENCPICGAPGRVKPPDPGGGIKPIKP